MRSYYPLSFLLVIFPAITLLGQDSLVFKNDDFVAGEIKGMDRGVLTIETDYSKSDFTIEWSGIKEIFTKTQFLITLTDGNRLRVLCRRRILSMLSFKIQMEKLRSIC